MSHGVISVGKFPQGARFRRGCLFLLFAAFLVLLSSPSWAESLDRELAAGRKAAEEVEKQWERVADPAVTARLQMLLERFLPFLSRPLPYEVRVIREKMVNAFSLPGGIIYFTTGMLGFLRTNDETAAILAHELIHADRRHALIQTARSSRISLAALAVMIATHGAAGPMILTGLLQVAITNSYGQDLEREADREGFRILVKAGFSPAAMLTCLEAMQFEQLKHPYVDPGVYMTHPELAERIDYILATARTEGVPLHRKEALHLLRTRVEEGDGKVRLFIDGTEAWNAPSGVAVRALFEDAAAKISASLQMETAPYDIQVISSPRGRILLIEGAAMASEPLPEGIPPLEDLRSGIMAALSSAQRSHQGAKYHR